MSQNMALKALPDVVDVNLAELVASLMVYQFRCAQGYFKAVGDRLWKEG